MSFDKKELTVKIDYKMYSVLEEYCEYAGVTEEKLVDYLLSNSLNDFSSKYNNLKKGYVEMGKINLEISNAFTASEDEALSYIED